MLEKVLTHLDAVSTWTSMYVAPVEVATVQSYLHGLEAGCSFGGLTVSREVYIEAAANRGWKFQATGIVWHMRKKGLDDLAIIQELIAVEAEAFRVAAKKHP